MASTSGRTGWVLCGVAGFAALVSLLREGVNGMPMVMVLKDAWSPGREVALFDAPVDRRVDYGSRATAFFALGAMDTPRLRDRLLARLDATRAGDEYFHLAGTLGALKEARALSIVRKRGLWVGGRYLRFPLDDSTLRAMDPVEGPVVAAELHAVQEANTKSR